MGFKFCTITSGSSGNCIYVGTPKVNILVDAGISGIKAQRGLEKIDVNPASIDGILLLMSILIILRGRILTRRFDIPLFATKTWKAMDEMEKVLGKISSNNRIIIEKDKDFILEDLVIHPYAIPHDASDL